MNFCVNDIHHFLREVNGVTVAAPTEMPMKEEWASWYKQWRVNKVQVDIEFNNVQTGSGYVMIFVDPSNDTPVTVSNVWQDLMITGQTQRQAVVKFFNSNTSSNSKVRLKYNLTCGKYMGNPSQYRGDAGWSGGIDTNFEVSPSKVINMAVLLMTNDGGNFASNYTVPMNMKVNFFCTMWSREGEVQ